VGEYRSLPSLNDVRCHGVNEVHAVDALMTAGRATARRGRVHHRAWDYATRAMCRPESDRSVSEVKSANVDKTSTASSTLGPFSLPARARSPCP
jgi:hypothetical protein